MKLTWRKYFKLSFVEAERSVQTFAAESFNYLKI